MPTALLSAAKEHPLQHQQPSYRKRIKQLAAQAPKPYGEIPPRPKRREDGPVVHRRLSHIEDWVLADSKEILPDEEELAHENLLSARFLTQVLPLHMPPPSLSDPDFYPGTLSPPLQCVPPEADIPRTNSTSHSLVSRRGTWNAFLSFSKGQAPSTTAMTTSNATSSPVSRWMQPVSSLRRSLVMLSSPKQTTPSPPPPPQQQQQQPSTPSRPASRPRRSEATTQPRFDLQSNTYYRDTRSNSDHLRMISAEVNMMRARKLLTPLKPRGFLPRRKDAFVRGEHRKVSPLSKEV